MLPWLPSVSPRWATGEEAGETIMVTGTPCAGNLVDSRLKELLPPLPVIYVKAVPVQVRSSTFPVSNFDLPYYELMDFPPAQ